VVPERESLHSSISAGSASGSIIPKTNEHFFVKSQPPAALPPFHEQAVRVQQVIQSHAPEFEAANKASVGTSLASPGRGLATTDISGQQTIHISNPPEAQKIVQTGATGGKQQIPPVAKMGPPESGSTNTQPQPPVTKIGPPEQENKGSQGFQKFGPPVGIPHQVPPESSNANGQHQTPGPVAKMGPPESGSTNTQSQPPVARMGPPEQENKGQGFQKFGSPAGSPRQLPPESGSGSGQPQPPITVSKLGPPEQQQDKSGDASKQKSGNNKSSQGWQKFGPPAGGPGPVPPENGGSGHQPQPPSQQQQQTPANGGQNQNHTGFQKFPSSTDAGTSQKPPLDLQKPIVAPRPTPDETRQTHPMPPIPAPRIEPSHGSMNGGDPRMTPPSPAPHIEPRISPPVPAPHVEPRMSPPAPAPHVEPRMSPPSPAPHTEPSHGGGGGDHSGGGGSHSSGSSGSSSHSNSSSDSKSPKGPH
jgi:hypothetical protein